MSRGTLFKTIGVDGVATWRAKYHDARGVRRSVTFGREDAGWTEKKARVELDNILADVRRGDHVPPTRLTVAAFIEEWFGSYAMTRDLKRSTRSSYRTLFDLHILPAFGAKKLSTIDAAMIESFMAKKLRQGFSPRSVNSQLQAIFMVLAEAVRLGKLPSNPAARVQRIRERRAPVPVMTAAEFQAVTATYDDLVAEASGTELYDVTTSRLQFRLTHELALRRAEALGLRWKNVHLGDEPAVVICETWTKARLDTPKSEAGRRRLRISSDLARALAGHRLRSPYSADDEFVLSGRSGKPLDDHIHADLYRRACKRAGVDPARRVNHDGRHSAISAAAASPATSAWALREFAGHSSMSTTMRYVHEANRSDEVAEAIAQAWRGEAASV
jgi:integrase